MRSSSIVVAVAMLAGAAGVAVFLRPAEPSGPPGAGSSSATSSRPAQVESLPASKSLLTDAIAPSVATGTAQTTYNEQLAMSPSHLLKGWDEVMSRRIPGEVAGRVAALGYSLRRHGDGSAYRDMSLRLHDASRPLAERLAVVDALVIAATPESVKQLLDYVQSPRSRKSSSGLGNDDDSIVEQSALVGIAEASRTLIEGSRNWAIYPVLESAWRSLGENKSPQLTNTLGLALAYLGKPDGVRLLIETAMQGNTSTIQYRAAIAGIERIAANDPVEVLGDALRNSAGDTPLSRSIFRALVAIGSADAAHEIVNYLDRKSDLSEEWLREVQSMMANRQFPEEARKIIYAQGK